MVIAPVPFLMMRHGQTQANACDLICGQTDVPLSATGHAEAAAAAETLRPLGVTLILTSPLIRARQTAEAVAALTGAPLRTVPGLAERNWGAWEGHPRALLRREETPPGGEGPQVFRDRILTAFAALPLDPGPVLIVAHSGTAREIHAALSPLPHRRLGNAEVVRWVPEENGWRCHPIVKAMA